MTDEAAKKPIRIHIDRTPYEVSERELTGNAAARPAEPADRGRLRLAGSRSTATS